MAIAEMLSRAAAELALFAGVGFLLFGINDVLVDLIYFSRAGWRSLTVYRRHARFLRQPILFHEQARLHRNARARLGRIFGHRLHAEGNAQPAGL